MDYHKVTIEKIERPGERGGTITKWVGRINGKFTTEALTRRDCEKWTNQSRDWLVKQDADPSMYY